MLKTFVRRVARLVGTKMPPVRSVEGLGPTTSANERSVRIAIKVLVPAAPNSGKMICGQRELPKRSDCPFEDYKQKSEFVTQWMHR